MYDRVTMAEADRDAQFAWGIEKARIESALLMVQILKADGYSEEKIKARLSVFGEDVVRAVWSALPPDDATVWSALPPDGANRSILESLEDKKNQVETQSKKPLADRPDR